MRRTAASCLLGLILALCACRSHAPELTDTGHKPRGPAIDPNAPIATLRVGLYPAVPRISQFQSVIRQAWREIQPRVALEFVEAWDAGYTQDPAALRLDVFVFDAIFLDDLRQRHRLRPLKPEEIAKPQDFERYALRGLLDDHEYAGIPMLGGAPLLFFRRGDDELAQASTLSQLVNAVGTCAYTSVAPHDARGLMLELALGTTHARLYADATQAVGGQWPIPLPWQSAQLDPLAIGSLQTLLQASSFYNSTQDFADPYQRARWFGQGYGRALAAHSDALAAFGSALSGVDFTILPLGDDPTVRRVFDAQVVGVSPSSRYADWSLALAGVMTSTEVVVASLEAGDGSPSQYLMPVRRSAFRQLGQSDPVYRKLQTIMDRARPYLFNLGPRARQWLQTIPTAIERRVRYNYACGCDQTVMAIRTQSDASEKCLAVCAHHDGWTGQWSAGPGMPSACACRSCPGGGALP